MVVSKRRLAVILVADVVGYSRLMEADEAGTLAALKERRAGILEPVVKAHGGRVVKFMGDGVLIEFASAVNAVEAALELQERFAKANVGVEENRHILLRIGINLGDVISEGQDIYGDGVNIAARLEALAEPGGLCISGQVHDAVRGKTQTVFTDMGEQALKNISNPVRSFRVARSGAGGGGPPRASKNRKDDRVAIAVLPFDNMSGDPEQTYFSDGITEDIITELSKYRELLVVARNSSFQFRGKNADIRDIAQKLGVDFIVEGSVRRSGNQIRVTAQLIEADTTAHVWAERFDRPVADIFAIQDEITQLVTSRVSRRMKEAIVHKARTRPTGNFLAYECFIEAFQYLNSYDTHHLAEVPARKAVELDPGYALAHAVLSITQTNKYFGDPDPKHLELATKFAKRALSIDPSEPMAHGAAGLASMYARRFSDARVHLDETLSLNHNNPAARGIRAMLNCYTRRYDEALADIEDAIRRDPYAVDWNWDICGTIMMACGRYREAISSYEKARYIPPWGLAHLAVCWVELGENDQAASCYRQLLEQHGDHLGGRWVAEPSAMFTTYEHQSDIDRFVTAFRRAAELAAGSPV